MPSLVQESTQPAQRDKVDFERKSFYWTLAEAVGKVYTMHRMAKPIQMSRLNNNGRMKLSRSTASLEPLMRPLGVSESEVTKIERVEALKPTVIDPNQMEVKPTKTLSKKITGLALTGEQSAASKLAGQQSSKSRQSSKQTPVKRSLVRQASKLFPAQDSTPRAAVVSPREYSRQYVYDALLTGKKLNPEKIWRKGVVTYGPTGVKKIVTLTREMEIWLEKYRRKRKQDQKIDF